MQKIMTAQEQADLLYHDIKELEHKLRVLAAKFSNEGNTEKSTQIWLLVSNINTASYSLLSTPVQKGSIMHIQV